MGKAILKKWSSMIVVLMLLLVLLTGCSAYQTEESHTKTMAGGTEQSTKTVSGATAQSSESVKAKQKIAKNGQYTTKGDVAQYIHIYGNLPSNFMTKSKAKQLGWKGGSLEKFAKGMCIGGDRFGNYEGKLPKVKGRTYYECDIDTLGKDSRGAKRIIYSDDGWIYYTEDHYSSFVVLYEGEK